jgi:hypothetical protein
MIRTVVLVHVMQASNECRSAPPASLAHWQIEAGHILMLCDIAHNILSLYCRANQAAGTRNSNSTTLCLSTNLPSARLA